jgi:DNA topoisomerase-1
VYVTLKDMIKNLVIVESPTKARTLSQYLGSDYRVTASMGHMRDLPRGEFGVDTEKDFEQKYVIPKEKIKSVNILVKEADTAENLWMATDPDREGEAIAWNILQVISEKSKVKPKVKKYERVVFHEITKDAILDAFQHPRKIDENLVEAQQARRILDRLVGYKLSPILWKKVKSGLSAGRVQSVALRLVAQREREVEAFKPEEYWVVEVELQRDPLRKQSEASKELKSQSFTATLNKIADKKAEVKNKAEADNVVADLEGAKYKVAEVKSHDAKKYPNPPFTTSTLQQIAAARLGYAPKRTMRLAQDLYEEGLITYMRTDSVNLSPQAVTAIRKLIEKEYGREYLPAAPRHYKARSRLAQEAHEAIRPTNVGVKADDSKINPDHQKLYDLIWKRAIVCQMAEAVVAETSVDVSATVILSGSEGSVKKDSSSLTQNDKGVYLLRANGQKVKFDGWYRVYGKAPIKEQELPELTAEQDLEKIKVMPTQKFTEPPSRYSEATLIRDLEKNDIGRPSTFAPTISTLYERAYIEKLEDKKIGPTPIGTTTDEFIFKYFPNIVDLKFTANMEGDLDEIAQGNKKMVPVLAEFWKPFEKQVDSVMETAEKMKVVAEETGEVCEKCGKPMVIRYGRFGKFMACSGFPDCKNVKSLTAPTGIICPEDGGEVVVKRTRRGRSFWGCANYPKCKYASWTNPTLEKSQSDKEPKKSKETKAKKK